MRSRFRTLISFAVAAALSATLLSAQTQTAKPKRDPDVPFVPTTEAAVQAMMKLGDVKKTDVLYDLGCGDGRIDINPVRIAEARENAKKAGVETLVRFEENDLFEANIHEATVVTLFLLPNINLKLKPKLLRDLAPGTRVVSNTFDMGDWKAEKESTVDDDGGDDTYLSHKFFLWTIPQRAAR